MFLANYLTPIPHLAALGITVGNTLSALTGALLLRRIPGFQVSLSRLQDVIGLVAFGAVVSVSTLLFGAELRRNRTIAPEHKEEHNNCQMRASEPESDCPIPHVSD